MVESLTSGRKDGTLLALAIGDALGAAVEFQPPGPFEPVTDYGAGGRHLLDPGDWIYDTSMMRALADSSAEASIDSIAKPSTHEECVHA